MIARYEQLRAFVLGGADGRASSGLITLLRGGVAVWLRQFDAVPMATSGPAREPVASTYQEEPPAEIVRVFADMFLSQLAKGFS